MMRTVAMAMMSSSSISSRADVTAVAISNSKSCAATEMMKMMILTMMIKEEAQLSQRNRATLRIICNFSF